MLNQDSIQTVNKWIKKTMKKNKNYQSVNLIEGKLGEKKRH